MLVTRLSQNQNLVSNIDTTNKDVSIDTVLTTDAKYAIVYCCDLPEKNKWLRVSKEWNKIANEKSQWEEVKEISSFKLFKQIEENKDIIISKQSQKIFSIHLWQQVYETDEMQINISFDWCPKLQAIISKFNTVSNENLDKKNVKNLIEFIKCRFNYQLHQALIDRNELQVDPFQEVFNPIMQDEIKHLLKSVGTKDINTLQQLHKSINALKMKKVLSEHVNKPFDLDFTSYMSAEELITEAEQLEEWCERNHLDLFNIGNLSLSFLNYLPAEIWQFLPNLTTLQITKSILWSLPDEIGNCCTKLQSIDLSNCHLTALPDSFSKLENLLQLNLPYNFLTSLPNCILQMKKLRYLDACSNHLSSLPDNFSELKDLRVFKANNNHFSSLPDSITELNNLEELELTFNQISSLSSDILKMNNLRKFDLSYNTITGVSVPDAFWASNLANVTSGVAAPGVQRVNDLLNVLGNPNTHQQMISTTQVVVTAWAVTFVIQTIKGFFL